MSNIFNEAIIGKVQVRNRIFRSATHEGLGTENGTAKDELTMFYERLAKGSVGAIIAGYCGVMKQGRTYSTMRMFDNDSYIDFYSRLNSAMDQYNTPVINQIAHGGVNIDESIKGNESVSPTPVKNAMTNRWSRELTAKEIEDIIQAFADAVVRSKKAGFSAAQLHCAHGYLLSEFLSPHANKRQDKWGGSTENRFRIVREIIERSRDAVGEYPIWAKFSAHDCDKGGISSDEGVRLACLFQEAGIDALEVSCGGITDGMNALRVPKVPVEAMLELIPSVKKMSVIQRSLFRLIGPVVIKRHKPLFNYNVEAAERIKSETDLPVIVVGGIRTKADIEDIVDSGKADAVSLCRPFIIEPNIVEKLQSSKQTGSRCINCGYCLFGCLDSKVKCYYGKIR